MMSIIILMSAINQLFCDNTPSTLFQYQTPKKSQIQFNTNASSAYSSFASNQFRSSELKYPYLNRNFTKEMPSSDLFSQKDLFAENNSGVTLNPLESNDQISQFLQSYKLIKFVSRQEEQGRRYILKLQKVVQQLSQEVSSKHHDILNQKKKYEQQKEAFLKRKAKLQQRMKKKSSWIEKQLEDMALQVIKIRHGLSKKKKYNSIESKTNSVQTDRQSKRKFSEKHLKTEQPNFYKYSSNHHPGRAYHNYPHGYIYQAPAPFHTQNYAQHPIFNPQQPQFSENHFSQRQTMYNKSSQQHSNINQSLQNKVSNPFDIIASKLRTTPLNQKLKPIQIESSQQDYLIRTKDVISAQRQLQTSKKHSKKQSRERVSSQNQNIYGSMHINVNHVAKAQKQPQAEPNLDYFEERSRSRILNKQILQDLEVDQKNQSENEDIQNMVILLQNSIRRSQKKDKLQVKTESPQPKNKKTQKKGQLGFNLVVSTNGAEDYDFHLPEKSREMDNSKIDISIDSDQKRHGKHKSDSSSQLRSKNQSPRNDGLVQSHVNIHMEQSVQSPENKGGSGIVVRKIPLILAEKILSNIEEVEEDMLSRQTTPIDFTQQNYQFKTMRESGKSRKNKDNQEKNLKGSSSNLSDSNGYSAKTPPLSRPPSLIQEEQADDSKGISGIMLSSESKRVTVDEFSNLPSRLINRDERQKGKEQNNEQMKGMSSIKLYSQSQLVNNLQDNRWDDFTLSKTGKSKINNDFDDIFGINLVTESRISRQNKSLVKQETSNIPSHSSLGYSEQFLPIESNLQEQICRSQQLQFNRYSLQQKSAAGDQRQQSSLRKSTTSSIVRKGSAIQKVKNREQVNSLKMSSYGKTSQLKNNSYLSNPIAQAEEEEEEVYQPTHKKNVSSFK